MKLLFIYNAKSGPLNAVLGSAHKYIRPKTYKCRLCQLTYSPFAMKRDWKNFVQQLPYPAEFLHADEFARDYAGHPTELPCIALDRSSAQTTEDDQRLVELISARQFEEITSLDLLKTELTNAIAKLDE